MYECQMNCGKCYMIDYISVLKHVRETLRWRFYDMELYRGFVKIWIVDEMDMIYVGEFLLVGLTERNLENCNNWKPDPERN